MPRQRRLGHVLLDELEDDPLLEADVRLEQVAELGERLGRRASSRRRRVSARTR